MAVNFLHTCSIIIRCVLKISAEILELAGNAARDNKKSRVTPRHILLAVANDEELHKLLRHVTIASGGVLPQIHPELLARKKGGKFPNMITPASISGLLKKPDPPKAKAKQVTVVKSKAAIVEAKGGGGGKGPTKGKDAKGKQPLAKGGKGSKVKIWYQLSSQKCLSIVCDLWCMQLTPRRPWVKRCPSPVL